ncbi:hypothetical protein [Sutcliffiella cohnii]|uniref:hypothetical protein n=1 Tax=Sutcliffiella cohnii TaxID=33932 RepID=UPI002E22147D|nr:hypothetical protein [Sutcliffiella cohnii]
MKDTLFVCAKCSNHWYANKPPRDGVLCEECQKPVSQEYNPKENKVLFVSEDGVRYKLFVDGHEVKVNTGVKITAAMESAVEINTTLLALKGVNTFSK